MSPSDKKNDECSPISDGSIPIRKFTIFMNVKDIMIISQFHFVMNSYIFFRKFLTSTLCTSSLFFEFTCTVFSVKFVFNLTSTSRPDCWSKPENLESAWRETTVSCIFKCLYILIFCLTWISRKQWKKMAGGIYSAERL